MDCCAICSAANYAIKPLYESLRETYKIASVYRDVLHVEMQREGVTFDAFFFSYGVAVFWGIPLDVGIKVVNDEISEYAQNPNANLEVDEFTYVYSNTAKMIGDEISVPDENSLTKLALSHGLAQSAKLGFFETSLQSTFNANKKIPEALAKYGKIPLSRKQIRCKMGELFIERNTINLHMDVLDTPEFFWEYPELDSLYFVTANYQDVRMRVEVLNQRLDVVHDLFEMLGTELNHFHSNRLEWIIIILIVMEVLVSLSHI